MLKDIRDFLSRSNLAIWGCGAVFNDFMTLCEMRGGVFPDIEITALVDSSEEKQKDVIQFRNKQFPILPPRILFDKKLDYNVVVTADCYNTMFNMLLKQGYSSESMISISMADIRGFYTDRIALAFETYAKAIPVTYVFFPNTNLIGNPSALENTLSNAWGIIKNRIEWLKSNPPHVRQQHLGLKHYSDDYIENIFTGKNSIRKYTGELVQEEHVSKYVNVVNGMRVTTDHLKEYNANIHIFGPSIAYGFGVEDRYTFASYLQRLVNSHHELSYKVLNYGVRGLPLKEYLPKICHTDFNEGDMALCFLFGPCKEMKEALFWYNARVIDLSDYFQRPHPYGEVFFDNGHFNYIGYQVSANIIFKMLFPTYNFVGMHTLNDTDDADRLILTNNDEFTAYMDFLHNIRAENGTNPEMTIGSIVMNANPFTLGHQHLVSIASKIVDFLYVFVVEENMSEFSFEERYKLVSAGTEGITNVQIIPSGKFCISTITFPEYFDKDNLTQTKITPVADIDIFGKYIAKELGITVRFVGEEFVDYITRQYNDFMKKKLPAYGIKLIEIPRIRKSGVPVSASIVREMLHTGETEKLKELVPASTYKYLIARK